MSSPNPLGFKPARGSGALGYLLFAPFFAIALGLTWLNFRAWRDAHEVASFGGILHPERKAAAGTIYRAEKVQSPRGQSAAGWVGQIGYLATVGKSTKPTQFRPICTRADLSNLQLATNDAIWNLEFALPAQPIGEAQDGGMLGNRPLVGFAELQSAATSAAVPAEMYQWCLGMPNSPAPLLYREALIQNTAHAEVLACADGKHLVACKDTRTYQFTSGSLRGLQNAAAKSAVYVWLFGGFLNLIVFGAAGLGLASRLLRSQASPKERMGLT